MENQAVLGTEHSATVLYLAFELSRKNWKLGFSDGRLPQVRQVTVGAGDLKGCQEEIEKAKPRFGLKGEVGSAKLLRSGARRILVASSVDGDGDREPGGGCRVDRGESTATAGEDGPDGCAKVGETVDPILAWRTGGVASGEGAEGRGRSSPAAASRTGDAEGREKATPGADTLAVI